MAAPRANETRQKSQSGRCYGERHFYIYLDFRRNGMTNLARRWQRFNVLAEIMSGLAGYI